MESEWLTLPGAGLAKTCLLVFYYAIYYAILFFTTLFTTLREAPENDLYVFWHIPNRQYGEGFRTLCVFVNAIISTELHRPRADELLFADRGEGSETGLVLPSWGK